MFLHILSILLHKIHPYFSPSMTPDRLVNLGLMAMHPKRLASISDISVFNSFISSGPRKLVYRRRGREDFFIYFQPSPFLPYTFIFNSKIKIETTGSLLREKLA